MGKQIRLNNDTYKKLMQYKHKIELQQNRNDISFDTTITHLLQNTTSPSKTPKGWESIKNKENEETNNDGERDNKETFNYGCSRTIPKTGSIHP